MGVKIKKIKWIIPFFYILCFPTLAEAADIPVPFTSQAPEANWTEPWFNACEETSVVMVDSYYQKQELSKFTAKEKIIEIFAIKNSAYGYSLDESAESIASFINNFLPWEAMLKTNPTLEDLKTELDRGNPVIIPAAGKLLHNPHFRNGGPVYHMLVVSGYDEVDEEFITQEPGTRFGKNYRYSFATVMNALHNYAPYKSIYDGARVAIFTRPQINTSAETDGDEDGLSKKQEIHFGTSLVSKDTDADGFSDKQEVETGFSATVHENNLLLSSLVKLAENPKVYLLQNHLKRHIINEDIFLSHGFFWYQIITVSDKFLASIPEGAPLTN